MVYRGHSLIPLLLALASNHPRGFLFWGIPKRFIPSAYRTRSKAALLVPKRSTRKRYKRKEVPRAPVVMGERPTVHGQNTWAPPKKAWFLTIPWYMPPNKRFSWFQSGAGFRPSTACLGVVKQTRKKRHWVRNEEATPQGFKPSKHIFMHVLPDWHTGGSFFCLGWYPFLFARKAKRSTTILCDS